MSTNKKHYGPYPRFTRRVDVPTENGKAPDFVGQSFNKWYIIERAPNKYSGHQAEARWLCKCVCGTIEEHGTTEIRSGDSWRCRECWKRSKAKSGAAFRILFGNYKRAAKKRGIVWELTEEQFRELTSSPCFYTGKLPSNLKVAPSGEVYTYNGIDRLDSTQGYVLDNCVPCIGIVNTAKMDLPLGRFIEMCQQVAALHSVTV